MGKIKKANIINDFVEWLEEDLNSFNNLYRKERNDWLDEKLREYKEMIYSDENSSEENEKREIYFKDRFYWYDIYPLKFEKVK